MAVVVFHVSAQPFPDEMLILIFRTVSDGFGESMGQRMSVGKKIIGAFGVPVTVDFGFPVIRLAHSGIALMLLGFSIVFKTAFGKHDPAGAAIEAVERPKVNMALII